MGKWTVQQRLVIGATLVALLALGAMVIHQAMRPIEPIGIETEGQPSIGNPMAKVEVVSFEDFMCSTCRLFTEDVYPKLQSKYIASGKVRYTFIPLAFIDGSKPLGNAALTVYKIAPDKFFAYVHLLFAYFKTHIAEEADANTFIKLAKRVGVVDVEKMAECLKTNCYYAELERNYYMAKELMGAEFGAPALFVNGVRTPPVNFRRIEAQIDRALYEVSK